MAFVGEMMDPHDGRRQPRLLVFLLRVMGCVTAAAFFAMLLPTDWMAAVHRALGLGEFPRAPIVEYLTRSIAGLYGFHGVLLLIVACDPRRYRTIVSYIAVMYIVFGAMLLIIDIYAGLPWYWTIPESVPIIVFGLIVGALNREASF